MFIRLNRSNSRKLVMRESWFWIIYRVSVIKRCQWSLIGGSDQKLRSVALEPDAEVDKCVGVRVRCDFSRVTHVRAARILGYLSPLPLIDPITELLDLHVVVLWWCSALASESERDAGGAQLS
ncbi:unnamed protein product [Spodoptera exigua]|nr:unnamed protein product [Spodoptera exigua]